MNNQNGYNRNVTNYGTPNTQQSAAGYANLYVRGADGKEYRVGTRGIGLFQHAVTDRSVINEFNRFNADPNNQGKEFKLDFVVRMHINVDRSQDADITFAKPEEAKSIVNEPVEPGDLDISPQ